MKALTIKRSLHALTCAVRRSVPWLIVPITSTCCFSSVLAQTQAGKEKVMEEVLVTAQRRQERLQDVPISISVLSGVDLDSSPDQGIAEAVSGVPGLTNLVNSRSGSTSTYAIRGVTDANQILGGTSPVGYYLDSIPFGLVKQSPAPDASPYDLDRVEVLRGPQGTLYGVSSTNGVIRILTKDADLSAFELKGRASASSTEHGDDSYRGDLAVNMPLVEGKLAVRAVIGYQDVGGWIDKPIGRDANDTQIKTGRLKLNGQPTDALSIGLSAWFSRTDMGAPPLSADGRQTPSVVEEPSASDYDAYNLKLDYQSSGVSLVSATSYLEYAHDWIFDLTQLGAPIFDSDGGADIFSQEINLASAHVGPWQWTAGAIYRDAKESYLQAFTTGAILGDDVWESESFAIFGELKRIFLNGRFDLIAGVRYFEDRVTDRDLFCARDPQCAGATTKTSRFDAVSPRVVLTWHPTEETNVYGSYGEGFRSGLNQTGTVQRSFPSLGPAEPDTLKNYEVGAKSSFWGGRAILDAAVFYIDWQDVQQFLPVLVTASNGTQLLTTAFANAASASGIGVEFAATVVPLDGLTLSASFGWNDLTVDEDVVTGGRLRIAKGARLNSSPETTGSVSIDYSVPFGDRGYTGRLSASASYVSEQTRQVAELNGDSMLLARVGLAIESSDRWGATLFVNNLFDKNYVVVHDSFLATWDTRIRPRTIGLQLEYRY